MEGNGAAQVVLVVEPQEDRRTDLAWALMNEGYLVMSCPGPLAPAYECPAVTGHDCPLASLPQVVVLDLQLSSDIHQRGTPGWQVLCHYLDRGKRIVALLGNDDPVRPYPDVDVIVLPRSATYGDIVGAVAELYARVGPVARSAGSR